MEARSSQSSRTRRRNRVASFYLFSRYTHRAALRSGGSRGPVSVSIGSKEMALRFEWYYEPHVRLRDFFYDRSLSRGKKPSGSAQEERRCKLFGSSARRVGLSAAVPIRG